MLIQKSNTNFQGGFLFPNMPKTSRPRLDNIAKRGKQIFDNFEKEGDVFLVIRDKYDKRVFGLIQKYDLKYKYFPEISTKSGLDSEQPEGLSKLLLNPPTPQKEKISEKKTNPQAYIFNILNSIKIRIDNPKVKEKSGMTIIDSPNSRVEVIISPISKESKYYVKVLPKISMPDFSARYYEVPQNGEPVSEFRGPNSIIQFSRLFKGTLEK